MAGNLKKYKDGEIIPSNYAGATGKLTDLTLGGAVDAWGEVSAAKGFYQEMNDGSGDWMDKGQGLLAQTDFVGGALKKGGKLADTVRNMSMDSLTHGGEVAVKAGAQLASGAAKKATKSLAKAAPYAGPVGDALTVAQSVRDLSGGTRSLIQQTGDEKASTALKGTAAAMGGATAVAGTAGSVAAASGAATAAAAGGAGIGATVSAGLAALGPIGWATLAVGAGAAALGIFGNKSYRKR